MHERTPDCAKRYIFADIHREIVQELSDPVGLFTMYACPKRCHVKTVHGGGGGGPSDPQRGVKSTISGLVHRIAGADAGPFRRRLAASFSMHN